MKQTKTNFEVQQDGMGIWGDGAAYREQMVGRYNAHKDGWLAGFEYALTKLGFALDQSEDCTLNGVTLTQEKLAAIAERFSLI